MLFKLIDSALGVCADLHLRRARRFDRLLHRCKRRLDAPLAHLLADARGLTSNSSACWLSRAHDLVRSGSGRSRQVARSFLLQFGASLTRTAQLRSHEVRWERAFGGVEVVCGALQQLRGVLRGAEQRLLHVWEHGDEQRRRGHRQGDSKVRADVLDVAQALHERRRRHTRRIVRAERLSEPTHVLRSGCTSGPDRPPEALKGPLLHFKQIAEEWAASGSTLFGERHWERRNGRDAERMEGDALRATKVEDKLSTGKVFHVRACMPIKTPVAVDAYAATDGAAPSKLLREQFGDCIDEGGQRRERAAAYETKASGRTLT
eukprot:3910257-Pleurochrysis_carterae.AAC.1